MSFLAIVFIVLMLLWAFAGVYPTGADGASPPYAVGAVRAGVPWGCVAILGWIVFHGFHGF